MRDRTEPSLDWGAGNLYNCPISTTNLLGGWGRLLDLSESMLFQKKKCLLFLPCCDSTPWLPITVTYLLCVLTYNRY